MNKLAIVVRGFDLHGAVAASSLNQARALSNDYAVEIITDASPSVTKQIDSQIRIRRVEMISFDWLRRFAHVPNEIIFILAIGLHILVRRKRTHIDIVVFHSHACTALLAPIVKSLLGCVTVMVMHGDIYDRPAGTYDRRLTSWYKLTTKRAYRVVDAVIALSTYMKALAIAGGAHQGKVFVVPNGVEMSEIGLDDKAEHENGAMTTETQSHTILFIGRIEFNKGVDLLVQAVARLKTHFPKISLCCIGAPHPIFMRSLRYQMNTLGVIDSVQFIPPVPRHELGPYYQSARVVAVPSRSETQSTVLMESMAASRPVVASDTGGNLMMVVHRETGLLFPSGDSDGLAYALKELLSDDELTRKMGAAARKRYLENYSLSKTGDNLRNTFRMITSSEVPTRK